LRAADGETPSLPLKNQKKKADRRVAPIGPHQVSIT
jgi:hypothetical protein